MHLTLQHQLEVSGRNVIAKGRSHFGQRPLTGVVLLQRLNPAYDCRKLAGPLHSDGMSVSNHFDCAHNAKPSPFLFATRDQEGFTRHWRNLKRILQVTPCMVCSKHDSSQCVVTLYGPHIDAQRGEIEKRLTPTEHGSPPTARLRGSTVSPILLLWPESALKQRITAKRTADVAANSSSSASGDARSRYLPLTAGLKIDCRSTKSLIIFVLPSVRALSLPPCKLLAAIAVATGKAQKTTNGRERRISDEGLNFHLQGKITGQGTSCRKNCCFALLYPT